MNENTLVAVCGYAGDAHQIKMLMPWYKHHGCPVLVLSPENAPITPEQLGSPEGVSYRVGGGRAWDGLVSLDRMLKHLRILLEHPQEFFLVHDADSFCVAPEIPRYLYEEPGVLWSREISDSMHRRPASYHWPRIAFHPPWFFNREVIERMLEVWDIVAPDLQTPFIDNHMLHLAEYANIEHKPFVSSASLPTWDATYCGIMANCVRVEGRVMVHSVKTQAALDQILQAYKEASKG